MTTTIWLRTNLTARYPAVYVAGLPALAIGTHSCSLAARAEFLQREFTVVEWERIRNTLSGNPVYAFALETADGRLIIGKTKPNHGFVYGLPSIYPGEKLRATLHTTPSGRVYMTSCGRSE